MNLLGGHFKSRRVSRKGDYELRIIEERLHSGFQINGRSEKGITGSGYIRSFGIREKKLLTQVRTSPNPDGG